MSKEELLKYLIAEIDLIMHDKDYRFENANGTWYSRESCRDLTNEEVFEELRTELRQFADLEAKLAESERKNFELLTKLNLKEYAPAFCTLADRDCEALGQIEKLKQQLAEKDAEIRVVYSFQKQKCDNLQNALAEKERQVKKLNNETQKYFEDAYCNDFHNQEKISFAIEQLVKVKEKALHFYVNDTPKLTGFYVDVNEIDNQIEELKKEMK